MTQTPNNIELINLKVQPKDVKLTIADPSRDEANSEYRSEMERASAFSFLHFLFMLKTTITARSLSKQGKSLGPATLPGYPYKKRPEIIEQSFHAQIKSQKKRNPDKKINFTFAVMNAVKWSLLVNILLQALALSLKIIMAWVAKNLLDNLTDVNAPASDSFIWAGILSANLLLSSYVEHHYLYQATLLPLHIRSGIISLIYTKITRLSVYSLNRISLGKLVNIVANDVNVFERTGVFFSTLVAGIYSLIGSAALLWIFFGPSCLVGIGYCILGFPLQQALAKLTNKPRDEKNAVTDERVKATNEVMDGIRLLKMYAWEQIFRDTIAKIRSREIGLLKKIANIESLSRGIAFSTQAVASFLIWMTYALTDHELSVSIVFPSFYLVGIIRLYSVFVFSLGLNFAVEAKLLMKRIQDVLEVPEIGDTHFKECMDAENSVEFKDFTAYWSKEESKSVQTNADDQPRTEKDKTKLITQENRPTLSNINLDIKKGSLNALIGKVGSGKSSFLLSFTGEMPRIEGSLRFGGSIAYVEQEPTIFAGTFRENILFGKAYEPEFYNQVVKACSLESDVKLFPNGDLSEIGEKGVNLSGGQKARLALARAVYADADIYLLDDPLSAVDAKVAKSLYHDVIMDQLKGKTVILATHQVHFVKDLENIIVMDDGKVIGSGCYEQLSKQNVDLDKIFSSEHKSCIDKKPLVSETQATSSVDIQSLTQATRSDKEESEKDDEEEELKPDEDKGKLFINEDAYAGKVDLSTYGAYIRQMGSPALILLLTLLYIGNELANVAFSRILGVWADGDLSRAEALGIMGGITVLILAFGIGKTMLLSQMLLKSARSFHDKMLDRILKNPVRFFDTNPVGRILNRFSNDLGVLDRFLPMTIMDVADYLFYICSLLITVAIINPIILAPVAVAAIMMVILLNLFYQSLKQTRNYELGSRSPLYSLFSSSLAGIIIIRSYKQTDNFIQKFRAFLHNNTKGSIAFCSVSRLFGFSIDLIYNLSAVASIFIVTATKNSNPGLSGLSISFILSVSSIIQVALRQTVQSNVLMASVGRVKAYCETSTEAALALPRDKEVKKAGWPQEGKIEMNKVYMKYRPTTDHVIKDLTLSAQPGEKIGCIGRTGAGKSSIIQILFRMVEIDRAAENSDQSFVKIDGIDSQTLGLHMLRNNISIIPQTPFVFTGTVKRNLDPIGQFTDEQLWKVLEDVNLKAHVEKLEKQLYTDMTNASSVFSVGQKQLICLARAILKKSKLLVLDEATANVDMETDNFIQKKIMEKFSDSTVFTIAHRLSTIANYDRVLVLDKGKKVEFDEPYKLLVEKVGDDEISNQSGHFASMVLNTGPRASKQIFKTAKDKFFQKDKNVQASENWAKKV